MIPWTSMQDPGSAQSTLVDETAAGMAFTREEYAGRVARTRGVLEKLGVDVLVAFANKVTPGPVRYLSGYETRHGVHDWSIFLLDVRSGANALLTNVSWEPLNEMSWVADARLVGLGQVAAMIADWIPAHTGTIGIAGFNALPAPIYAGLLSRFSADRLRDISQTLAATRKIKSRAEIEILTKCTEITDAGGQAFLAHSRQSVSEREILVEVEAALKRAGSDEVSFTTQVGSGPRTAVICPYATDRRLRAGDLVQLDCGATHHGYRGDLSRVAAVAPLSARLRFLADVTAEMYETLVEALRPGVESSTLATIGLNIAKRHGVDHLLYRSPAHPIIFMGHSIGCSYIEPPELHLEEHSPIEENMIIVIEPILMEKGVGGVKLEDAVWVTSGGAKRLSSCPLRTW